MQWRFREKQRAEIHQNPVNTEFFAQQDVAERLVREAAQNAMDAASDGETARLVFKLTTLPASYWSRYFGTLWPHLEAQPELEDSLPERESAVPCLLVEDFGTSGLTGPLEPTDRTAAERDERNHRLFWFFKNVGRTSKTDEQLGSFGIGKTVFPYSSRINSFFGYSVRATLGIEPRAVMLGQSQLREHRLNATGDLDPFGFFAIHEGAGVEYIQHTVSDVALLDEFRAAFGLRRVTEPGLSVVIPYPAESLSRADLAKEAIRQFFLPILSSELVVEIQDGDSCAVLSATTLLESINEIYWGGIDPEPLRRQVQLAIWALTEGQEKIVDTAPPVNTGHPEFSEALIDREKRAELSREFIAGKRLAIRVPVPVEPKGSREIVWSSVEVYMEHDRNQTYKWDIYVRKGLTLVELTGQARQQGLRAILVARDGAIYKLLRSSENVAHTKWRNVSIGLRHLC